MHLITVISSKAPSFLLLAGLLQPADLRAAPLHREHIRFIGFQCNALIDGGAGDVWLQVLRHLEADHIQRHRVPARAET